MLTAVRGVNTSARYLAIERINGRLRGHSSRFKPRHGDTMTRGTPAFLRPRQYPPRSSADTFITGSPFERSGGMVPTLPHKSHR